MIDLTQDRLKELLDYDPETGIFRWRVNRQRARAGAIAGWVQKSTRRRKIWIGGDGGRGRPYFAARLAWLYVHGRWPRELIDHINRVRDDDRLANLREATKEQNCANQKLRRNNTSGVTGVYYDKKKKMWLAYIYEYKKQIILGWFQSIDDAAAARARAAHERHGEFARIG